jgi:hypothetical protein
MLCATVLKLILWLTYSGTKVTPIVLPDLCDEHETMGATHVRFLERFHQSNLLKETPQRNTDARARCDSPLCLTASTRSIVGRAHRLNLRASC